MASHRRFMVTVSVGVAPKVDYRFQYTMCKFNYLHGGQYVCMYEVWGTVLKCFSAGTTPSGAPLRIFISSQRTWDFVSVLTTVSSAISSYRRFPDKTFSGQDLSRTITFPDKTFPGHVILRNFHVHHVCKYQLYWPNQTIYRYTERLLIYACRPAVTIWGLFGKACSATMGKATLLLLSERRMRHKLTQ